MTTVSSSSPRPLSKFSTITLMLPIATGSGNSAESGRRRGAPGLALDGRTLGGLNVDTKETCLFDNICKKTQIT